MNRQQCKRLEFDGAGTANQMKSSIHQLELEVLCKISQMISQSLNLDQTLGMILETLSKHLSMKRGTITLKHEDGDFLSIRASHGLRLEQKKRGIYSLDEGVTGLIFRTAEPFVVPDISKEPLFLNKTGSRGNEKGQISFIGVPIVLHGLCVGVLNVDRIFGEDVSFEEDIRFLTILASLMADFVSLNRQVTSREENFLKDGLSLKVELSEKTKSFFSVGSSRSMSWAKELIRKVAPTKVSVLLMGESGTGKSLIAQIIHELSNRARFPFIKVSCAALPSDLLESELFGFEKGAFAGAIESKAGRFESADGGTIFLDGISEIPLPLQVKLLRFLQDREFERMGSTETKTVDVRIIAATNKDLSKAVADGSFREDLFYRLNVFPIRVPLLRERREDILPLINFFSEKIGHDFKCGLKFSDAALDTLLNYSWHGNVRESENLTQRLAIMFSDEIIDDGDLLPYFTGNIKDFETQFWKGPGSLHEREKRDVVEALAKNKGNLTRVAQELGITLRQMGCRVRKFELKDVVKQQKLRRHTAAHKRD